ncbi:MAG: lamin tail domain-containing protein [Verrucomicrobiales bacterium]|nr:lamin tail domain-containing protein [Verrucomicrobiales bacterium]
MFFPYGMDGPRLRVQRWLRAWVGLAAIAMAMGSTPAATTVHLGQVRQISGPQDLDLTGDFVYAVNFSADDGPRTVAGVTFQPDRVSIPGASFVGPQQVTGWQAKPEFGATADANELEEILHDIRWANAGANERLRATLAVQAGESYRLQILISGNTAEDRRWDLRINGREAVDELTSLGSAPGNSYQRSRATLFEWEFESLGTTMIIEMGDLFGAKDGGDRNPIWQALTLERTTAPPFPDDLLIEPDRFFARSTEPIGHLRAVDRRPAASHVFSFVAGVGGEDNAKFSIAGSSLVRGLYDFERDAIGTVYRLRVRAEDASDPARVLEKAITVRLVEPHRPERLVLDVDSVRAGGSSGALVAKVRVTDADDFDRHRIEWASGEGDQDNGRFQVVDGSLRVGAVALPLPFERSEARIRLRATDLSGASVESAFVLPLLPSRLELSEILATKVGGITDADGQVREWFEIRNAQGQYEDLAGWFVSDNREQLRKWAFQYGLIGPGQVVVVLAMGGATAGRNSSYLSSPVGLDSGGEWLGLVPPDGAAPMSSLEFPRQFPGVSFGLASDGLVGFLAAPTPGAPNAERLPFGDNRVLFGTPHGFYSKPFALELEATVPGSVIRYTLDGSAPTPSSGTIYSAPIQVTPNTAGTTRGVRVVRAIAVRTGVAYAPVETQTYFFVDGVVGPTSDGVVGQTRLVSAITRHATYGPMLKDAFRALPTVSVLLPGGPTSEERRGSLEWIDPQGAEAGFQIDGGIEVTGTTSLNSPKLGMSAKFRAEYGSSQLQYPVFAGGSFGDPTTAATVFKELRLRGHSHDTFYWLATRENPPVPYGSPSVNRSADAQYVRNLWIDQMQGEMGQPTKLGRQVHLYLNGSYHGLYHVHEHVDGDFMATYFGGSPDDYQFTAATRGGSNTSDGESWATTWAKVKASLSNYGEAQRWIDVAQLCDYMILAFYAGNDWDWSSDHNWSAAGPRLPDRGGWKFFHQDSDIILQDVTADCTDQNVPDGVFQSLMRFADFRVLFRDRVYRHCFGNGALTPARASAVYDARMNEIREAIVAETARWQPSSTVGTLPWDRDQEWTNEWRYLKETFFPQRTDRLMQQLRAHSGWWPVAPPAALPGPGTVATSNKVQFSTSQGTVYYTTDGSDPRLPGGSLNPRAISAGSGSGNRVLVKAGSTWRFLDKGAIPGAAWLSDAFDDRSWSSGAAEIGYGDGDEVTTAGFLDADPNTDGLQKNITTYFRTVFDAPSAATVTNLIVRLVRDDGAVVYLNGRELWRVNMPEGVITPTTRALVGIGGADESTFFETQVSPSIAGLRASRNVLAVEIHQQTPESSDISFDLELVGESPGTPAGSGIPIHVPTMVRARSFSGGDWSAIVEGVYRPEGFPEATPENLVVSEVHYHPREDAVEAEFVELWNSSDQGIEISGVKLGGAVAYEFPSPSVLEPGERCVVAKDLAAFDGLYLDPASPYYRTNVVRFGPWTGALANSGETLEVRDRAGNPLFAVTYSDRGGWPSRADGDGSSLELAVPPPSSVIGGARSAWLSDPSHWRASDRVHGSPGSGDAPPVQEPDFAQWAAAMFPPQTPAEMTAPMADFDGDGISNYGEYAFALDPRTASASPLKLAVGTGIGIFSFEYRGRPRTWRLTYALEVSSDLQTWDGSEIGIERLEEVPHSDGIVVVRGRWTPNTGATEWSTRFLRLVVRGL